MHDLRLLIRTAAVLGATLLFVGSARADESPPEESPSTTPPPPPELATASTTKASPREVEFGTAGQVVLGDVLSARTSGNPGLGGLGFGFGMVGGPTVSAAWFEIGSSKLGVSEAPTYRTTNVRLSPSADVFVSRRISLGATISVQYANYRTQEQIKGEFWGFSVDPRVGYAIPITESIGLWPRFSVGISFTPDAPSRSYRVGVYSPLTIRLARHAMFEIGPEAAYQVADYDGTIGARQLFAAGRGGLSLIF